MQRSAQGGRRPSVGGAVARFTLGSVAAIAVVVIGGFFALRPVAIREAERATREQVQVEGRLVASVGLSDGLLRGDPAAISRLDDLVQGQVLDTSVVRVKVWSRDGTILYSDEAALIGQHFGFGPDEQALFRNGGTDVALSDLTKPENRYERSEGKLLEAHTVIRTPNGSQVLFEIYQRFTAVSASGNHLLSALAPPLLGGLFVLLLFQVPLGWSTARRLQRGHRDREELLTSAIEASSRERRRIASDLHDGAVQALAGVAFGLAPLADAADRRGAHDEAGAIRQAIARLRQGVRELRTLLVEIHPPSLETAGLEAALSDLLSPLEADGIATGLHVDDRAGSGSPRDPLIYRVAREAVRNAQSHADAASVRVDVTRAAADTTRLVVSDDGRGFDERQRELRLAEGHLGLSLLEDLVEQAGGTLAVHSEPGHGTKVELEVPAR
ncbi:MAG: two-component system, NarL family, sensor kinase [Solirubrobacteraceae bacterium]|jgi:signal transduction histidine kinase|nr:two-component system, NarL family, sensor kinase [Solirubrobacteraceae bacterium]